MSTPLLSDGADVSVDISTQSMRSLSLKQQLRAQLEKKWTLERIGHWAIGIVMVIAVILSYVLFALEISCLNASEFKTRNVPIPPSTHTVRIAIEKDRLTSGNITLYHEFGQHPRVEIDVLATNQYGLSRIVDNVTITNGVIYISISDALPRKEPVACRRVAIRIITGDSSAIKHVNIYADVADVIMEDIMSGSELESVTLETASGHAYLSSNAKSGKYPPPIRMFNVTTGSGHVLFDGYFADIFVSTISGDIHSGILDIMEDKKNTTIELKTKLANIHVERIRAQFAQVYALLDGPHGSFCTMAVSDKFIGTYLLTGDYLAVIDASGRGISTSSMIEDQENERKTVKGSIHEGWSGTGYLEMRSRGNNIARLELIAE